MTKKEKKSVVGLRPTTSYSPVRGPNQDYGGVNVKNDNANYTISDEHIHDMSKVAHQPEWEIEKPATRQAIAKKLSKDTDPEGNKRMKKPLREVTEGHTLKTIKRVLSSIFEGDDMVKNLKPIDTTGGSPSRTAELAKRAEGEKATPAPVDKKKEAAAFLAKEEAEQIDELSKKTLGSYIKKASVDAKFKGYDAGANDFGGRQGDGSETDAKAHKRLKGVAKATDKLTKEEVEHLDEARGRPKKDSASDSPDTHPIQQARQVISTRGMHPFTFADGKKHQMNPMTAHRILAHHDNLHTPAEKEAFASRIHRSVDSLHSWLAGKPHDEELPKISLGGSSSVGGMGGRSRPSMSGDAGKKKKK